MTFFRLCWFASLGLSAGRSGKSDFLQDKWASRTRCIQMLLSSVGPGTQHSQKEGKQAKDASAPLKIMILFNNMSRGYTAAPWTLGKLPVKLGSTLYSLARLLPWPPRPRRLMKPRIYEIVDRPLCPCWCCCSRVPERRGLPLHKKWRRWQP